MIAFFSNRAHIGWVRLLSQPPVFRRLPVVLMIDFLLKQINYSLIVDSIVDNMFIVTGLIRSQPRSALEGDSPGRAALHVHYLPMICSRSQRDEGDNMKLPEMALIEQHFDSQRIDDVEAAVVPAAF